MKILILGSKGMLGSDICSVLSNEELSCWDQEELDITDEQQVIQKITDLNPKIVINPAAFTDVDGCETNKDLAFQVNGTAVKYIAEVCKKINSKLIHFSTDYVFDGSDKDGYKEDDHPKPINVYGESKLMAENHIRDVFGDEGNYAIIRISFLFGKNGDNFIEKILKRVKFLQERGSNEPLKVVDTQLSCPTYTLDLAKRIPDFFSEKLKGTFHLTNKGAVTKYEFVKEILKIKALNIELLPAKESDFPLPAKRPAFSELINTKIPYLRDFKDALKTYLTK